MAKVKKKGVPPHIVIPDTSVLWHGDKTCVVSPFFDAFWGKNCTKFHLQLVVPQVVRGELLFQQVGVAHRHSEKIADLTAKLSAISDHAYSNKIKPDVIKSRIESRFDKWLTGYHGAIEVAPVKQIDWNRLLDDAIWRKPPFAEDKDDKDFEKGFRDAVIIETVIEYCRYHANPDIRIAFVCGDNYLRKTASTRLSNDQRFSTYESFPDFESYLNLTEQKLTDQFIRDIRRRASEKFFTGGEESCLARRDNVVGKIQEKFKPYFSDPSSANKASPLSILSSLGLDSKNKWEPIHSGMFWVGATVFEKLDNVNIYHWNSTVTFAQLFKRTETQYAGAGLTGITEVTKQRVLILPVSVMWHARVKNDARFHDITMDDIILGEKGFRAPTAEDRKAFNLPEDNASKDTSQ